MLSSIDMLFIFSNLVLGWSESSATLPTIIVSTGILEIRKSHGGFFLRTIIASRRNLWNPRQSRWFFGANHRIQQNLWNPQQSRWIFLNFGKKKPAGQYWPTGGRERKIITMILRARRGFPFPPGLCSAAEGGSLCMRENTILQLIKDKNNVCIIRCILYINGMEFVCQRSRIHKHQYQKKGAVEMKKWGDPKSLDGLLRLGMGSVFHRTHSFSL